MLFKILAPFKYSPDGISVLDLDVDTPPMPVREDIRQGLVDAKLVEEVKPARARAAA